MEGVFLSSPSYFLSLSPYFILCFVICILLCFLAMNMYIRLKYGFWYYQPVFHAYDFRYYFFPCGIVQRELPEKNKFTNFQKIKTLRFDELPSHKIQQFVNFIVQHFHRQGTNIYLPSEKNVVPYFTHHREKHPCWISFFETKTTLHDIDQNKMIDDEKIVGVMTTRPLHLFFTKSKITFPIYYVDYLCVDKAYRNKNIAPQIIQTHEYVQRHNVKDISVSLFKREGELTGIVPLAVYSSYCFDAERFWKRPPTPLPNEYNWIEGNSQNMHHVVAFFQEMRDLFQITVQPENPLAHLLHLIQTENMYISFVMFQHEIQAVYCFKCSCMLIDREKEALTCFASVKNDTCSQELFIRGFKTSVWKTMKKKPVFGFCVIENVSHNHILINHLRKKTPVMATCPTAYFLYNYVTQTVPPHEILVIL